MQYPSEGPGCWSCRLRVVHCPSSHGMWPGCQVLHKKPLVRPRQTQQLLAGCCRACKYFLRLAPDSLPSSDIHVHIWKQTLSFLWHQETDSLSSSATCVYIWKQTFCRPLTVSLSLALSRAYTRSQAVQRTYNSSQTPQPLPPLGASPPASSTIPPNQARQHHARQCAPLPLPHFRRPIF